MTTSDAPSSYHELAPERRDDLLACRWEQRVSPVGRAGAQRVIPDARADIIVSARGDAILVGPTMRANLVALPAGTHLRGLRLRTEALRAVLGVPGAELRDAELPLSDVLPRARASAIAEDVWAGRYPAGLDPAAPDPRIRHAIGILAAPDAPGVAALAARVGLSERQLRRLVIEHSGLEPRAIGRVARLHRFLGLADGVGEALALAGLAHRAGYADQAHLGREVRELAGTTPLALLRERGRAA